MKKILFLLIIVMAVFACNSDQKPVKSDLVAANLKGNVWKIDKMIHDASTKIACPCGTETECNKSKFVYDKKGNLIESYKIDEFDSINEISKYSYNRQGLCTEIATYKAEKLTEREVPVVKGGKVTGCSIYNEAGIIETEVSYVYSGDEITEEKTLNGKGEFIGSVQREYLSGQLVSQTEKDTNGDVKSITRYKRNERNDIIESLIFVPKDKMEFKLTYEYEYDSAGNWVKQTQFYAGAIYTIVVRNIEYFKS
jgi:hypothetical protein